ncbi:lactococcin 972 family bacteriocin [Streptomyces sp. NPDC007369]|uniref:lactococcin 972 family bacteriocin n=1 Tax=Streptomyces sp. NPDC007369 TaxID=3154589 RepID=UPI0033C2066B
MVSGMPPPKLLTGWIALAKIACKLQGQPTGGDFVRNSARRIGFGFAAIAVAIGGFVTPAAAASPLGAPVAADGTPIASDVSVVEIHKRGDGTKPPAELGNPSEWGVVKITMDDSAIRAMGALNEACVPASGGNWCYGWYLTGVDATQKRCYSNYYHYSRSHRSSVKLAGVTVHSGVKAPNETANASRIAGAAYTCYTYYSVE